MNKFYPMRGKVAIQRIIPSEQSNGGIIFTPRENVDFVKGKIMSIGLPTVLPNGKEVTPDYLEGDFVLYPRKSVQPAMGWDMVNQEDIVAVIDEDTEIS